ncbi:MAG: hypothetical protein ACRDTJ_21160, partial [Pseudonocardiaceae bacterium]
MSHGSSELDLTRAGKPSPWTIAGHHVRRGARSVTTRVSVSLDHTTDQRGTVGFESLTGDL